MVLYFSATGNTRFVAEELASRTGDTSLNLLKRIRENDFSAITSDKPFVICTPVYVCEIPPFVRKLISKTPLEGNKNVYFIFTSGGYSGICGTMAKSLARRKGLNYMGSADFKMPRNYIANNTYPELTEDEIRQRISDSYDRIPQISEHIFNGERIDKFSKHVWLFELIITIPFTPVWRRVKQGVKGFHVSDRCTGCGKCVNLCPLNVIRFDENRRPVWDAKMCEHCMACIQNCPVEAIDYGNITQSKKRYTFTKYGK